MEAMKRSSNRVSDEIRKRLPIDSKVYNGKQREMSRLTFSTVSESVSQSSEDLTEAFSKQFSLFKTSSSAQSERAIIEELRNDSETEAFRSTGPSKSSSSGEYDDTTSAWTEGEHGKFMSPTHRTDHLLNVIGSTGESQSNFSSPLQSIASSSSQGSWEEETQATGSRDYSLLDNILGSLDDGSTAGYATEGGATTDGNTTLFGDGDSIESEFEEFSEEDGLRALAGVLYQIGSCNLVDAKTANSFDDFSVTSEVFPPLSVRERPLPIPETKSYLGFNQDREVRKMKEAAAGARRQQGGREGTPIAQRIFESIFKCTG